MDSILSTEQGRFQWRNRLLAGSETPFSAVAQTVGFDLGKSKMLVFQWGLSDTLSATALFSSVSDVRTDSNE
jgi:hypothetical protein